MNGEDSIEARLKRQPPRQIPAAWRREILEAARVPGRPRPSWLVTLLWPHPKAWAGLAAVWLLVFGLNFAARDASSPAVARQAAQPASQIREMLRQQQQILAELAGPAEEPRPQPRVPVRPQPRSERRGEFRNT